MVDWIIYTSSKNCTHTFLAGMDGDARSIPYTACGLLGKSNTPCTYFTCPRKIK